MRTLLWVDDIRDPTDYVLTELFDLIVWATTAEYAFDVLEDTTYNITDVSLDNDLGTALEGNDVLCRIEYMVFNKQMPQLKTINIHSHNPSAVEKMVSAGHFLSTLGVKVTKMRA